MRIALAGVVLLISSGAVHGQWLNYPTPGIPRLSDGKPDMVGPTPRTVDGKPDFSDMWRVATLLPCNDVTRMCTDLPISAQFTNIGAGLKEGLPYQAWAREKMATKGPADDPYTRCLTPGGPRMHLLPTMKKFVQTPALLMLLNEYNAITVNDPKAYTQPWTVNVELRAVPDTEMLDAQCLENEKDVPHLLNAK